MNKKKLKVLYNKLDSIEAYAQSAVEMLRMQMELELAKHHQKGELQIHLKPTKEKVK